MDRLTPMLSMVILLTSLWSFGSEAVPLNDYILDYQPLVFNSAHLHDKHSRVKRAIDPYLRWNFKAYGRTFNLELKPSQSIFAPGHDLVFNSEPPVPVDTSFVYDGIIAGDPTSSAHLTIVHDSVSGFIRTSDFNTYHIEPARKYLNSTGVHTIIYPESRMNLDPYRHKRAASGICGTDEMYRRLGQMWTPVESSSVRQKREVFDEAMAHNKYTEQANLNMPLLSRKKRADNLKTGVDKTCFMHLRADKLLYDHIYNNLGSSASEARTKDELISMFATHVKAINDIYTATVFEEKNDPSVRFTGINFQLQRTTIITNCDTNWDSGYCLDNLDVSNFLDLTAAENHDEYCLVHTFTYRDFVGGTLGLAWVADPDSRNSGVCGQFGKVRDSNNGISSRSLNTGIVTQINFQREVPARVSQLTFAHEVGHNFGAKHDTTDECAPFGTSQPGASNGNYIMFPSATQGNLPNNAKFSSCSKDNIAKVLNTVVPNGVRINCFKSSNTSFCGNNIVEGDEECDCGFGTDCKDKCCNARSENGGQDSNACTLVGGYECSPSMGKCCKEECSRYLQSENHECAKATECTGRAVCDGSSSICPDPVPKEDNKTFCSNFGKVCVSGDCIGSVCQNIGWIECFLTSSEVSSNEQMCYVSCRKNENSECISSFDQSKVDATGNEAFKDLLKRINDQKGTTDSGVGVKRPAGSPCNDFKGYCDVFSKCRNVDAEGPFQQLTDLIFDPVTLKRIENWIVDYWWAVLLMAIGVVVFMGVFVKIFGYNTPSKNPKRKSQPPPRATRAPATRAPQPDKRQSAYATDVPMYDRPYTVNNQAYENHGYVGPSYQEPSRHSRGGAQQFDRIADNPPSYRGHQQYDRVSGPRRY